MQVQVLRSPVYAIIFRNFFPKKINELILIEAQNLKTNHSVTGADGRLDKKMRTNRVIYYDTLYEGKRKQSILLTELDKKFNNEKFQQLLLSSPHPLCEFAKTNYHETQVSNYNRGQKYDWHTDAGYGNGRMISLVYWFFKEPKKFSGGQLGISNSPIWDGNIVKEGGEHIKEIEPENNMAIVFSSAVPHSVIPAYCKDSEYSRYSANIWIGSR